MIRKLVLSALFFVLVLSLLSGCYPPPRFIIPEGGTRYQLNRDLSDCQVGNRPMSYGLYGRTDEIATGPTFLDRDEVIRCMKTRGYIYVEQ